VNELTSQEELLREHSKQAQFTLLLQVHMGEDRSYVVVLVSAVNWAAKGVSVRVQRLAFRPRDDLTKVVGNVWLWRGRTM
jgi:hypothetical protein